MIYNKTNLSDYFINFIIIYSKYHYNMEQYMREMSKVFRKY